MPAEVDPSRRPLKSRSTAWAQTVAGFLVKRRVSPNAISVVGIGFAGLGAAGMFGVAWGWVHPALGLLVGVAGVQLRLLCNLMDGLVAVEGKLKSKAGTLFNEAPDRLEDVVLLVGAGFACGQPQLGWACAALALTTAYLRAFGASLGLGQDYSGPCAKQHRMAVLSGGLLAGAVLAFVKQPFPALEFALWVIVVLTAVTVIRRTLRIYRLSP